MIRPYFCNINTILIKLDIETKLDPRLVYFLDYPYIVVNVNYHAESTLHKSEFNLAALMSIVYFKAGFKTALFAGPLTYPELIRLLPSVLRLNDMYGGSESGFDLKPLTVLGVGV